MVTYSKLGVKSSQFVGLLVVGLLLLAIGCIGFFLKKRSGHSCMAFSGHILYMLLALSAFVITILTGVSLITFSESLHDSAQRLALNPNGMYIMVMNPNA